MTKDFGTKTMHGGGAYGFPGGGDPVSNPTVYDGDARTLTITVAPHGTMHPFTPVDDHAASVLLNADVAATEFYATGPERLEARVSGVVVATFKTSP